MKSRLIKILMPLSVVLLLLAGCGNAKVEVPSEVTDGYMLGDYETYAEAAKVNGKKYDKLYVVGKFFDEPFEDGNLFSCYFVDENNKKYLLKMDSKKTELKDGYVGLKDKYICACGIYGGSLKKDPMPVIYTNKIYDIKDKKTLVSQYYGEYYGDFDENGKIISTDYDEDDNTFIDFHSIQIQIPYNYMESELHDTLGQYFIQNDGIFCINYKKEDLRQSLSTYTKKKKTIETLKNQSYIELLYSNLPYNLKVSDLEENINNSTISYNIKSDDVYGNGMLMLKNDGVYLVTLITDNTSRFNRVQDFTKIIKSIKKLSPARQPKSTGIHKMIAPKNNTITNNTSKAEDKPKTNAPKETSEPVETKVNNNILDNGINGVVDEYKKDIDDAKSQLNDEIDKAADQLKDEMGLAGDLFGGYIDKYSDAYKKAINTVGDTYKDVADDYGKAYQDILNGLGY